MNHGVYFSANDAVIDWSYAFLSSFRQHNPTTSLFLIPFDDQCSETIKLSRQFAFEIYQSEEFSRMEEIGRSLELGHTAYGPHWFRRYAAFWGPLDEFAYFDARQIVFMNLDFMIIAPRIYGLDLVFADTAIDQVYEPGLMRNEFLRHGGGKGFISNSWASVKGLFTPEDFSKSAQDMAAWRGCFNARNTDQAFINYCCDSRTLRTARIADLSGDLVASGWARHSGHVYLDSKYTYRLWDYGGLDHGKRVMAIHWAGMPFSILGPHGRVLYKYMRKSFGNVTRTFWYSKFFYVLQKIRSNRFFNQTYKQLLMGMRFGNRRA